MRLAVISDTHLSAPDARFSALYEEHIAPADVLLHCGDMVGALVYNYLARHPHFHCVRGNCDHFVLNHDIPVTLSRDIEHPGGSLKLGMAHGWGERGSVWRRVAETFPGHGLICFGHTHRRLWEEYQGAMLLNPGSVAEGSMALLDIAPDGALTCTFLDI